MISILQGKKVSQLLPIDVLSGTELVYIVDNNGTSWKASVTALIDLIQTSGGGALIATQNLADLPNKAQARDNLELGSVAIQDANDVNLTGGSINNTVIGNSSPAYGRFSELIVTTSLTIPPNSISIAAISGNIPNSKLENSSIEVVLSAGLTGGGIVELGGTLNIDLDTVDGGDF